LTICVLFLAAVRLPGEPGIGNRELATPELYQEADPKYDDECFSMGRMTIEYASGAAELPNAGFRITDPRGREIGYDPRTNSGWQEMPLAQAFLECEQNEETGELKQCKGHVEICGPVSGTYRIEILPMHSDKYAITVSATSKRVPTESGFG